MRVALLLLVGAFVIGCRTKEAPLPPAAPAAVTTTASAEGFTAPVEPSPDATLKIFDRTWKLKGPARPPLVPLKEAWEYECNDPTVRLLLAHLAKSYGPVTIALEQVETGDKQWVDHGIEHRWDNHNDGTKEFQECTYVLGKMNGIERIWRNNQLIFRRTYVLGMEHGLSEGWYHNGRPMYRSLYSMGKEVPGSGQAWNEDGSEARVKPISQEDWLVEQPKAEDYLPLNERVRRGLTRTSAVVTDQQLAMHLAQKKTLERTRHQLRMKDHAVHALTAAEVKAGIYLVRLELTEPDRSPAKWTAVVNINSGVVIDSAGTWEPDSVMEDAKIQVGLVHREVQPDLRRAARANR